MDAAPATRRSSLSHHVRTYVILALSVTAVSAASYAFEVYPDEAPPVVVNTPYTGARLLCVVAIGIIVARLRGEEQKAWRLIAVGTLMASLGDLVYDWYDVVLGIEAPYPGVSDLFDLSAYGFWMAGVVTFPYSKGTRFAQWRLMLDGAAGAVALGLMSWWLYLADAIELTASTWSELVVGAAYPIADFALLVGLVVLSSRRTEYRLHRPLIALATAFMAITVADLLYLLDVGNYADGGFADGMWVAGHGLIVVAAWLTSFPPRHREYADQGVSVWRLVVPYSLVGGLALLTAYQVITEPFDTMTETLVLGSGFVSTLIILRQTVALREYRETVEQERRDLVASISHELRTPLTAMSGFSRVLADDWQSFPEGSVDEMLGSVAEQTEYLGRIVTDLIEVSRDNLRQVRLNYSMGTVADTVGKAISLSNLEGQASVTVEVDPDVQLRADHGRLTQILVNLLANASRYGNGRIHVRVTDRTETVSIEVHDDGDGVPIRYRQIIWERFERGVHRYDAANGGTGLGLPIAKGLTTAHDGTLTYCDSDLLGGACFRVHLPKTTPTLGSHLAPL